MKSIFIASVVAAAVSAMAIQESSAQAWPVRPVRMIVPLAPGGSTDIMGRLVAARLQEEWGRPVLIENRPGASTIVGTDLVAKAAPDGYTLLVAASPHANNVALYEGKLPYDTIRDFAPIALISTSPLVLTVNANLPIRTVKDLVQMAKEKPGEVNFATASVGGVTHLAGELFNQVADIKTVYVAYKGNAPALTDVAGGRVHYIFNGPVSLMPFIKSGKLRPIAASSRVRVRSFPDVPTMGEEGFKGFEATGWLGLIGQAKVPRAVIEKINAGTNRALRHPDVVRPIESDGSFVAQTTPEEFGKFINDETEKWAKVIRAGKIKPQ